MTTTELGKKLIEAMIEGKMFSLSDAGKKYLLKNYEHYNPQYCINSINSTLEITLNFCEEKSGNQFNNIEGFIPLDFINLNQLL